MHSSKQENQNQKLYRRLSILFAGYQPKDIESETSIDYFTDNILYNSYKYVHDLKELAERYQKLSQPQKSRNLEDILQKVNTLNGDMHGVNMSKIEVMALQDQMKIIYPYKSRIDGATKGVFKNIEDFLDISNGIRKYHLIKAQQSLPNIFNNMIGREEIKNLLKNDYEETNRKYSLIEAEVSKKINAVENINKYYESVIQDLGAELDKL